jgi:hypothetical protein
VAFHCGSPVPALPFVVALARAASICALLYPGMLNRRLAFWWFRPGSPLLERRLPCAFRCVVAMRHGVGPRCGAADHSLEGHLIVERLRIMRLALAMLRSADLAGVGRRGQDAPRRRLMRLFPGREIDLRRLIEEMRRRAAAMNAR